MTFSLSAPPPPDESRLTQAYLTPGTLYCSTEPTVVSTVLGSCVAVCLIDRHNRAAGMNHFVLPHSPIGEDSLRYGDVALNRLLERMIWFGCAGGDLRAKVFGGASVLPFGEASETVGVKNVRSALAWLRLHDIPVIARRTGGRNGLLLRFHTASGQVLVRKITTTLAAIDAGTPPSGYHSDTETDGGLAL